MANRVLAAIEKTKMALAQRLADRIIDAGDIERANQNSNMDMEMYVRFQEMKSIASTGGGPLTLEEGMTIYGFMGETLEHYNAQPVEVKIVLIKIFHELLGRHISSRRR